MDASNERVPVTRLMFGGDVMLGRNVKEYLLRFGAGYPLGPIAPMMRNADLTIVNLECAITASLDQWPGAPKMYYFGAPPPAIDSLVDAGIDMVSLANNHTLDFGIDGLHDTLAELRGHGILPAGAGIDLDEALSPAVLVRHGMCFGMAAFCDHQADFRAEKDRPGIAYLDFDNEFAVLDAWRKALARLRDECVDWPILSLHWGPNMALRPSIKFRRLAHAAIEMGWKILFGHSAHVFQGIEIYRGCPIIYAAGDLVDDYRVDPALRNDYQLLIEIELARGALQRILLHPVFIGDCRTHPATPAQADDILGWMGQLCGEMGTRLQRGAGYAWIDVGPA